VKDSIGVFQYYKKLAERAMAQCTDSGLFETLEAESNSIAIIVKHVAGNMRSRWTDFLTSDGGNLTATATRSLKRRQQRAPNYWKCGNTAGNSSSARWNH